MEFHGHLKYVWACATLGIIVSLWPEAMIGWFLGDSGADHPCTSCFSLEHDIFLGFGLQKSANGWVRQTFHLREMEL